MTCPAGVPGMPLVRGSRTCERGRQTCRLRWRAAAHSRTWGARRSAEPSPEQVPEQQYHEHHSEADSAAARTAPAVVAVVAAESAKQKNEQDNDQDHGNIPRIADHPRASVRNTIPRQNSG